MPQMSSLFWLNLFLFLILNYMMMMILINSILMKYPMKIMKIMKKNKKFLLKW